MLVKDLCRLDPNTATTAVFVDDSARKQWIRFNLARATVRKVNAECLLQLRTKVSFDDLSYTDIDNLKAELKHTEEVIEALEAMLKEA